MDTYSEISDMLNSGEFIEEIILGPWHSENESQPPMDIRRKLGKRMVINSVIPYLDGWSCTNINGCYSIHVWTNRRVIFNRIIDGEAVLMSVPRSPENFLFSLD